MSQAFDSDTVVRWEQREEAPSTSSSPFIIHSPRCSAPLLAKVRVIDGQAHPRFPFFDDIDLGPSIRLAIHSKRADDDGRWTSRQG